MPRCSDNFHEAPLPSGNVKSGAGVPTCALAISLIVFCAVRIHDKPQIYTDAGIAEWAIANYQLANTQLVLSLICVYP